MSEKLLPCPYVIAGPWTDDDGQTFIEIQRVGGHELIAQIYADKAEAARLMAEQAITAWNTRAAMQADAAPDALAVINRIAEVSSAFACQAGVGGMETAGSIISFLATNPQRIPDFMAGGSVIDWPIGWHTAGCLSWHGMDGKIHWPGEGNIQ